MSRALEAALSYAARGWRVHPLHHVTRAPDGTPTGCSCGGTTKIGDNPPMPNGCAGPDSRQWGKHPRGPWTKRTTTEEAAIRDLWRRFPFAGVGIACGPGSDLWVLDVDGEVGLAQLDALQAAHGALPDTWTVQTGSGGRQLYFRWPGGDRKPTNRTKLVKAGGVGAGEGIDARGDGGQVVAPPSVNRNGGYSVISSADPVHAPAWLLDLVCPPAAPTPRPSSHPAPAVSGEGIEKRLRAYLAKVCNEVASTTAGGQNALNKAAWGIGRKVAAHPGILSDHEVYDALYAAAMAAGLPSGSTATTLRSTLAKAAQNPEPLAERERPAPPPRHAPKTARPAPAATEAGADSPEEEGDAGEAPTGAGIVGLPEGWVTPPGWILAPSGVWEEIGGGKRAREVQIAAAPIWIAGRRRDADSGAISLELAWTAWLDGRQVVERAVVGRAAALHHRELHAMIGGSSAPISSESARGIVRWLEASEAANAEIVPLVTQISRFGWTVDRDGRAALQTSDGPHLLALDGAGADYQAAAAPSGTWEAWLDLAAQVHAASPLSAVLLASTVASVLLQRLGAVAAPFVVDVYGGSTTGKSVAARWALSGWAAPAEDGGAFCCWDQSPTSIEGRAAWLRNYALYLDDTKKIKPKDKESLSVLVYNWSSGQGRGRGTVSGRALQVARWRSVLISTGESSLIRLFGEHAGARLRTLPLDLAPFPDGDPVVARIEDMGTWGHLAPRVGARIVEAGDAALRARWTEERERLAPMIAHGARGLRLAGTAASIMLAVDILQDVGVWIDAGAVEAAVLAGLRVAAAGADLALESWTRLCGWLAACEDRISDRPGDAGRSAPPGGWIGRALARGRVALLPSAVEGELRRLGYVPEEVLPQWAARGWLVTGDGDRRTQVVRWRGMTQRLIVLDVEAGTAAPLEIGDEEDAPELAPYH